MTNIPNAFLKQIQDAMLRPIGTGRFKYYSDDLMDSKVRGGIIIEIPSGGHVFRLERDDNLLLHYYHSSPGTGTRVSTIDLKKYPYTNEFVFIFSWTPESIKLSVKPKNGELVEAIGTPSPIHFSVGKDGKVIQIGNHGVTVMGARIYKGGQLISEPSAIESWKEIKTAIQILSTGSSKEGHIFEVARSNLSIAIIVTGFEVYTNKRFLELENEGIKPNIDDLINAFFSKGQRYRTDLLGKLLSVFKIYLDSGLIKSLKSISDEEEKSILETIVDEGIINFQNFQRTKKAYNKAYNIKFGELDIDQSIIESIQKYILYTHRIIHITPLLGILNQADIPKEEPVFPNDSLVQQVIEDFSNFIESLHNKTLSLNRVN